MRDASPGVRKKLNTMLIQFDPVRATHSNQPSRGHQHAALVSYEFFAAMPHMLFILRQMGMHRNVEAACQRNGLLHQLTTE
ncbi:hypothetical protein [Pantoea sp. AS142]|uniref:hypothetical protein n=1 Tax=Pantoea sp. AS142 TaxID=3081292 RepID=UPI003019FCB7